MYIAVKYILTSLVVVAISEMARRQQFVAAVVASLPLTSILAFIWIYYETQDVKKITQLSTDVFWLVLPSLAFFLVLPVLLKKMSFTWALLLSCLAMSLFYGIFAYVMNR